MKCFEILKIEPTKNIREIKKAYSHLLKIYHPEEHSEEFKKIHQAYVEALNYAKSKDVFEVETDSDFPQENVKENSIFKSLNEIQEENIETDNHENILEEKFKIVENYEKVYTEKEKMIFNYFKMIADEFKRTHTVTKDWFKHPVFKTYYQDEVFIEQYIRLIDQGLYNFINLYEKRILKKIHNKYYFFNKKSKKKYKTLYDHLRYNVYQKRINVFMVIFLFFIAMLTIITSPISSEHITEFMMFEIVLLAFYARSGENHKPKHMRILKIKKFIRRFVPIFIILCFVINNFYIIGVPTSKLVTGDELSIGEYDITVNDEDYLRFEQIDGDVSIISQKEDSIVIKTRNQQFDIPYSHYYINDMNGFGFEGKNCYYAVGEMVFNTKFKDAIFCFEKNFGTVSFINNEKYCLILERSRDTNSQLYRIKDNQVDLIYKWNKSLYDYKVAINGDKLYYGKTDSGLWCLDLSTKKENELDIQTDNLMIIDFVNDYMFLGYVDYSTMVDYSYDFHGVVQFFVNIENKYFAYINDSSQLYVVDLSTGKEIIGIDLYKRIDVLYNRIFYIGGTSRVIGIYTFDGQRIDIEIE